MRNKYHFLHLIFFALLAFISATTYSQTTVTIGTGTYTTSTMPAYGYYGNSWSQQIYTASEINTSGNITKIAFQVYSASATNFTNQKIYLKESTLSNYTSGNYVSPISDGATLVYDGNVTYSNGWVEITFQTPFSYSGNNNLIVYYENRNGIYASSYPGFYANYNSGQYLTKYYYNSSSTTAYSTSNGYTTNYRNNIKLSFQTAPNDLAVTEWVYPSSGSTGSSNMPVMIKVKNVGTVAQSGFVVKYSVDNGANWKSQTYSSTLASGNQVTVNFFSSLTADMSATGVYQCIAVVRNTGDTVTHNDTLRQDISICGSSYSGSYTVGTDTASDFPSIASAFESIETCGISGPVTLRVKDTVNNSQLYIANINGITASTPVTVESYSGNPEDVVFQYSASSTSDNYVLRMDSCSFITFKNITFKALGSTYSNVVTLFESNNCTLNGNKLIGATTTSSSTDQIVLHVYNNYLSAHNNLITNNLIYKGSYGLRVYGSSSAKAYSNSIINNEISEYYYQGVYLYYADSFKINSNYIHSSISTGQSLYISNCNGGKEIIGNKLVTTSSNAIYLYYSNGIAASPTKIANNFIHQSAQTAQTVYLYQSSYINFDFNSIHSKGSNSSNNIYIYGGSNYNLRNNNVINMAGGYVLYASTQTAILSSDYNNYFTSGNYIAYWNGNRTTLSALQSASGKEANSLNNNVTFYTDENLHISGSSLNNLGTPVAGITTDYDGQIRNATTPDIGADEFSIYPNDGGLTSFQNMTSICPGSAQSVKVSLKNFGYNALTNVNFGWSINGNMQSNYVWTGLLGALNTTTATIGSYSFSSDTTYSIKVWIKNVNSTTDSNAYNDTIILSNYHTSFAGGTYQIGSSSSADFLDIAEAMNGISQYGICGPIVFNIESGTYVGQYTLSNITGQSSTNTITFQSLTGDSADVILSYAMPSSSAAHIFLLDGASYFNFKNLTLKSTSIYYSRLIYMYNFANHIIIDGCNFIGVETSNSGSYYSPIYANQSNQITIQNSSFEQGSYAIMIEGTSSNNCNGIKILGNRIRNFYIVGAYLSYVGDSLEVVGNNIMDRVNSYSGQGIYKNYGEGKATISHNNIKITSSTPFAGIQLYYHNYPANSSSNAISINNNFIEVNTTSTNVVYGIYSYSSYYTNFYYNTIKINGGATSSAALYCNYSYNSNIKNNIFDVGNQYAFRRYNGTISSSDYNNFYSTATYPIYYNTNYTLASYKSYTSLDAHSKNVNPNYVSSGDLHLFDVTLNNAGTPISGITTDYDGESRSTSTPDIGADEYAMLANDAALYAINSPNNVTAVGSTAIKVALRNMGTSILYYDSLYYQIDGGSITSVLWTGYLAPLSVDSFILLGNTTLTAGSHTLKAWTTKPNSVNDLNKSNDTLTKTFTSQVMPTIVVSPNTLIGNIYTCNDSVTVPLKIYNTGGATLTGTISGAGNAGGSNSLQVLLLTYGASATYYNNLILALDATFTNYTLTLSTASSVSQLQADLVGKDVIIMPYLLTNTSYQNTYLSFASTFQNFVYNGGNMIFSGQYSGQYVYISNTGLWPNTSYSGYTSGATLNVNTHPITAGLNNSSFTGTNDYFFYHTGTPSNYTPLITYSGYQVAGIRTYGSGLVAHLGFRYYEANQTPVEQLISNTLGYMYNQSTNWLHNNDSVFTVAAGDSTTINYVMSGVGLSNGNYYASIEINSNDYGNPTVIVPCTMNVIGSPIISSVTSSVNFGGTFVNIAAYDTLEVLNTGCGDLVISNITATNTAFTIVNNNDTIVPGDTGIVVYKFLTSTPGAYSATSTIYSNTSNYTINLASNATNPPVVSATPSPMNVTVTYCNDSVTANLSVQNTGGGTLTATVEELSDSVEIIVLTYGQYTSYTNNMIASLDFTFTKFNYTTLNTISASVLQNQINSQNAKVIIIPYLNGSSYASAYSSLASTLQSFTSAGGTVIFTGQYYDNIFSATGLISGTYIAQNQNATLLTQNTNDPVTLNFSSSYYSGTDDFNYYTFTGTGITSLVKYGSYDMVVRKAYGAGHVFVIGHFYNTITQSNTKALVSNCIKYASEQGANWLQYSTSTMNLGTGTTALKPIKFNANGLSTGVYTAQIKITSNSPSNPVVIVPCTLTVQNQMVNGVNLGSDTTNCGALTLNAGSYSSYLWNTANTTQTISAVSTGTYSVTVSNGGNCTSSDAIAVTINPVPSVSFVGVPNSSCSNGNSITLNASPTGGVFAGPGITGTVFSPATAGSGTHNLFYSYTNIYNCSNSASQQITVYNPPTVSFTGLNATYCPQGTASVLTGIPAGGSFTGSGIVGNSFVPSLSTVGTHSITYSFTDVHNCSNTSSNSTTVTAPAITIGISGYLATYCVDGSSSTLVGTPAGGTFSGPGVVGSVFNPAAAGTGTHYITYQKQDVNSCMIKDSVAVTVYALPSGLTISGLSQSFCANDAPVALTGFPSGGVFTGNGMSGSNFSPSGAGAGTHNIVYTFTDVHGCSNSTSSQADVNAIPTILFTNLQSQYCIDDNPVTVIASPTGGTLSGNELNNGVFDPNYAGTGSFYVYYEYTDASSCYNQDSFNIVVNDLPTVDITSLAASYCSNSNPVTLTGTPTGGSFTGNGVNGSLFNPSTAGVGAHYVFYDFTDNNGCSNTDSTFTAVSQVHGVNAGPDDTITYNTSAQLTGIVSGGGTSFSFSWTPANFVNNPTQLSPTTIALTNSKMFTLSVTDNGNSCVNSDQVMIIITGGTFSASANATPAVICQGESSQLQAIGSGGSGNYTYNWSSTPAGFSSTLSNPLVTPTVSTTYSCVINDGTNNVTKQAVVQVNPTPQMLITNLANTYCNNENVVNLIVSPPGGTLTGSGITGLTFNPAIASLGQNMIIYSMTNASNCYGADTVMVDVLSAPSAYAGQDTTLPCINNGISLGQQPVAGVSYLWNPPIALSNHTIANPTSTPNLSINYELIATNIANGCTATDMVNITVIGAPTAHASNDTTVCPSSTVNLNATGGDTYFWSNGSVGNSISVSPSVTTLYYVIVSQAGCADLDTVYVYVSDPKPSLGVDTTLCGDLSITLDAGAGFTSYNWSTNANSQSIVIDSAGIGYNTANFSVTVVDTLSCVGADTIAITFTNCIGLNDVDNELFSISIYPNPSKGMFVIESNATAVQAVDMQIVDVNGKLIISKKLSNITGIFKESVNLSTQPKGVYFIKLMNNNTEKVFKVLVQ